MKCHRPHSRPAKCEESTCDAAVELAVLCEDKELHGKERPTAPTIQRSVQRGDNARAPTQLAAPVHAAASPSRRSRRASSMCAWAVADTAHEGLHSNAGCLVGFLYTVSGPKDVRSSDVR